MSYYFFLWIYIEGVCVYVFFWRPHALNVINKLTPHLYLYESLCSRYVRVVIISLFGNKFQYFIITYIENEDIFFFITMCQEFHITLISAMHHHISNLLMSNLWLSYFDLINQRPTEKISVANLV